MAKVIQFRLFEPPEVREVEVDPEKGDYAQNVFLSKFKPKKTTDDCYTPAAVYDAVINYVDRNIMPLHDMQVLRPFQPGGDYLAVNYTQNCVVVDNPPFSIYRAIIRNYCRLGVKFFLFAPALTLFVPDVDSIQYIICRCNITYDNGAKVRTAFVTNMLNREARVILSGSLSNAINAAQKRPYKLQKIQRPYNIQSSADLMRFVPRNGEIVLKGSAELLNTYQGRKIFGAAMQFNDVETELFKMIDDGRA